MINLVCEDFAKWVINNWPPLLPAAVIRLFPRSHPHIGCGCCDSSIWTAAWREVNNMSANITCSGQCQGGGALDVTLVSRMSEHENRIITNKRPTLNKENSVRNKQILFTFYVFVVCPKVLVFIRFMTKPKTFELWEFVSWFPPPRFRLGLWCRDPGMMLRTPSDSGSDTPRVPVGWWPESETGPGGPGCLATGPKRQ